MAQLNNKQLVLLSHLIYGIRQTHFKNGSLLVGEIAEKLVSELNKGKTLKYPIKTPKTEWMAVLKLILKDKKLSGHIISHFFCKDGMKMATVRDRKIFAKDMTIVFQGSVTANDWEDNAISAYVSDTPMQKTALNYVRRMKFLLCPRQTTTTGHSKGGNYAQYCAIRFNSINRAVAFDAPGFSPEFLEKYAERIKYRAKTIHNISASKDFIHGLLFTIPRIKQTFVKSPKMKVVYLYHKFSALIDLKTGEFYPKTDSEARYVKIVRDSAKTFIKMNRLQRKRLTHGITSFVSVCVSESKGILSDLHRALRAIPDLLRFILGVGQRRVVQKRITKSLQKWKKSGMMARYATLVLVLVGFWNSNK